MPSLLIVSIVASVVLTVLLNLVLRIPRARRRLDDGIHHLAERSAPDGRRAGSQVRVIVPWKAMLIGSLVLTAAVNLLLVVLR